MTSERKVGAVVAIGLLLVGVAIFLIGQVRLGVAGYELKVQFRFVNNLKDDAMVKYAGGPTIGHVRGMKVDGDLVTITLWIDRSVRIRQDSEIWIFTAGMLGEQYIEIDASPSVKAPYLAEGATVRGIDPVSLDATLNRLGKLMDALAPVFANEEVAASVHSMINNLNMVSKKIAVIAEKHAGKVDAALGDLETFARHLTQMTASLNILLENMKALTDPKDPDSLRAALVKVNTAMDSAQISAHAIEEITAKMDQGKGTFGTLLNDEKLASDLKEVIKKFKEKGVSAKVTLW